MRSFEDLVAEAQSADVSGWGFSWLDGRAIEARPSWGYAELLARRLAGAERALDLDTGGGEVVNEATVLPRTMIVTEAWPPNAVRARQTLGARGVSVVDVDAGVSRLPFGDAMFDLVTARHPVRPNWSEVHRVLRRGGTYFAQHVGPASAFELIEYFLGPLPEEIRAGRDPQREADDARSAGLTVERLLTARCRMEFFDVGAVVWILRKCVWWVPGFSIGRYDTQLRELDEMMRSGESFVAHSTRHLITARRPAS
ncbi:class I SAM-dependent methyltransferase [Rudaeicoccus suwonensis]|nr:methyltransferase domain-containing protein [Rudaeicoccus suwonensis]